jgi:hypothetical protein
MRVIANLAGLKHKYGQNANKVAGAAEGLVDCSISLST